MAFCSFLPQSSRLTAVPLHCFSPLLREVCGQRGHVTSAGGVTAHPAQISRLDLDDTHELGRERAH